VYSFSRICPSANAPLPINRDDTPSTDALGIERWIYIDRYSQAGALRACPGTMSARVTQRQRKAARKGANGPGDALLRKPITGIVGCCARATTGHAATSPSRAMNSRRRIHPSQSRFSVAFQTAYRQERISTPLLSDRPVRTRQLLALNGPPNRADGCLLSRVKRTICARGEYFRFWHEADLPQCPLSGRYQVQSGHLSKPHPTSSISGFGFRSKPD
jgi:hypothetical protein